MNALMQNMQQMQQQMLLLAAATGGAAGSSVNQAGAGAGGATVVDSDPGGQVMNGMKDDARDVIDEWHQKGWLPRGTVKVIGPVLHTKVSKHIQSRNPQVPLRLVKTYVTNRLSYIKNNVDGPGRWKYKKTVDHPDGFYVRYSGPAAGYRIFGARDWPTTEETEACLAVARGIADGKPLTEGVHFDLFTAIGAKAPDLAETKPKVKVKLFHLHL
jgi:hypothetical protein